MNLLIKLRPNTSIEWFQKRLVEIYPSLADCGTIYDAKGDGKHILVYVSVDDQEAQSFARRVILISSQVVSIQRA